MVKFVLAAMIGVFLLSCNNEKVNNTHVYDNYVNLANPQIGQISRYFGSRMEDDSLISATIDSLHLEVVAVSGDLLTLEEKQFSNDTIIKATYRMSIHSDTIIIGVVDTNGLATSDVRKLYRSDSLLCRTNAVLDLHPDSLTPATCMSLTLESGTAVGIIPSASYGGVDCVNPTLFINNVAMSIDANGFAYVISSSKGLVRQLSYDGRAYTQQKRWYVWQLQP